MKKNLSQKGENKASVPQKKNSGNREIVVLTYLMTILLLSLAVYFGYYLTVRSSLVINSTYNKRSELLENKILRGSIYSSDGEVLARTVSDEMGTSKREYPFGSLFVHVLGRYTHGKTGLELSENFNMLRSNINPVVKIANELQGKKNPGDNIFTTLDTRLQKAAAEALGSYRGAVVAMEPDTGKILAMVSKPDYDPDGLDAETWDLLTADEQGEARLLNRATQGVYPPGSTFKILTALEYMREHKNYKKYQYDCTGNDVFGEVKIKCYGDSSHGLVDLKTSFLKSCNTSFANIGMTLDKGKFRELCDSFLFNTELLLPFSCSQSSFVLDKASKEEELPQTAIGQGKTGITPMHNAMITAAIANGGILMKPYFVDRRENAYGETISKTVPSEYATLMTKKEALQLTDYMKAVVESGTASSLKGTDYQAAGKTGSAEFDSSGKTHAWFVGFAPADNPEIAVSVILEEAGSGGTYAVPAAKKVLDEYFKNN